MATSAMVTANWTQSKQQQTKEKNNLPLIKLETWLEPKRIRGVYVLYGACVWGQIATKRIVSIYFFCFSLSLNWSCVEFAISKRNHEHTAIVKTTTTSMLTTTKLNK